MELCNGVINFFVDSVIDPLLSGE